MSILGYIWVVLAWLFIAAVAIMFMYGATKGRDK